MAKNEIVQKQLAYKLGLSEPELSRKFNGDRAWTNEELDNLFEVLDLALVDKSKLEKLFSKFLEVEMEI